MLCASQYEVRWLSQDLASIEEEAEPEPEIDTEQQQKQKRKEDALKAKDQGNAAYKARKFDEAVSHYDRAYELNDEDISFLTNRLTCSQFAARHA